MDTGAIDRTNIRAEGSTNTEQTQCKGETGQTKVMRQDRHRGRDKSDSAGVLVSALRALLATSEVTTGVVRGTGLKYEAAGKMVISHCYRS